MNFDLIRRLKEAVVVIGYYIPYQRPEFLGTGFLVGLGDRALTCAHVVEAKNNVPDKPFRPLPQTKIVNGKKAELSCWSFAEKDNHHYIIKCPIENIAIYTDLHVEAYYLGGSPDVAYLVLDVSHRNDLLGHVESPALHVSHEVLRTVGTDVIMIGYPSTNLLMTDGQSGKPKCMEPLAQFTRLSGVLPFSRAQLPQFLAFDTLFAPGSSGSPIIDIESGKVIAMAAQFHPFKLDTISPTYAPSSIGFGIPSNLFHKLSLSRTGEGRFDFNEE